MKVRKLLAFFLVGVLAPTFILIPAMAATPAPAVTTPQTITVDGKDASVEVYNLNGSNYIKLRDIAMLLNESKSQFSVAFDNNAQTITATTGEAYAPVGNELQIGTENSSTCVASNWTLAVNGLKLGVTGYNIDGNNFFKVRDLGTALGLLYHDQSYKWGAVQIALGVFVLLLQLGTANPHYLTVRHV